MIIAQRLKQENIAEYLLYMWQVEDLLRSVNLNVDKLADTYLSRFSLPEPADAAAFRQWYADLADMMRSEGVAEQGHLQICNNVLIWLTDLHNQLLRSTRHPDYNSAYYKALPFIVELRAKNKPASSKTDNTPLKGEIENCFDALYGLMLLRLQGKTISDETTRAMQHISQFIALLSDYYRQDKAGKLEF